MVNIFHICSNCVYRLKQWRVGNIRRLQLHLYERCAVFFTDKNFFKAWLNLFFDNFTCVYGPFCLPPPPNFTHLYDPFCFLLHTSHIYVINSVYPHTSHMSMMHSVYPTHLTHVYDPFSLPQHFMHVYNSLWLPPPPHTHLMHVYDLVCLHSTHHTYLWPIIFTCPHTRHTSTWSVLLSHVLHTCIWSVFFTHTTYACI